MDDNTIAIMVYCGIVVGFGLLTILFTVLHKKMKKKVHKLKQECSSVTKATVVEMRIKKLVEDGTSVSVKDFGVFNKRQRNQRTIINPNNGEKIVIPSKVIMGFETKVKYGA